MKKSKSLLLKCINYYFNYNLLILPGKNYFVPEKVQEY